MAELLGSGVSGFRKGLLMVILGALLAGGMTGFAFADEKSEIVEGFIAHQSEEHGVKAISDHRRHQILFVMGACLLIAILATAGFGVAMAIFGKEVFIAHMVFAGITVFLAAAHAVASIVWFFPF